MNFAEVNVQMLLKQHQLNFLCDVRLLQPEYDFFKWAKSLADTRNTNSLLSKALNYAIHQEAILRTCLDYGQVELTNNASERCIKPFVIGRKNWMFCNTPNVSKVEVQQSTASLKQRSKTDWIYKNT